MLKTSEIKDLKNFAANIRMETMKSIASIGTGHTGGALSIADILALLYGKVMKVDPANPEWEERDWMILSKGHSGPALYATLGLKGYFPVEELLTLNKPGTNYPSHCDWQKTKGIDMSTGSLGQGASTAVGIALGHKMNKRDNYVYLMLGDGEIQEGQVWEAALFANQFMLDNVIAFVDWNKLQLDGYTEKINDLGNISKKFEAFGWYTQTVNGHDFDEMYNAIEAAKKVKGQPSMIILDTVKGKGYSKLECTHKNHSTPVSEDTLKEVLRELKSQLV